MESTSTQRQLLNTLRQAGVQDINSLLIMVQLSSEEERLKLMHFLQSNRNATEAQIINDAERIIHNRVAAHRNESFSSSEEKQAPHPRNGNGLGRYVKVKYTGVEPSVWFKKGKVYDAYEVSSAPEGLLLAFDLEDDDDTPHMSVFLACEFEYIN